MRLPKFCRVFAPLAIAGSCAIAVATGGAARAAENVVVPGATDFPESMHASADGTLYFSSFAGGADLAGEARRDHGERIHQAGLERPVLGARGAGGRQVEHPLCVLGRHFGVRRRPSDRRHANGAQALRPQDRRAQGKHPAPGGDAVQRHRSGQRRRRLRQRFVRRPNPAPQAGRERIRGLGE